MRNKPQSSTAICSCSGTLPSSSKLRNWLNTCSVYSRFLGKETKRWTSSTNKQANKQLNSQRSQRMRILQTISSIHITWSNDGVALFLWVNMPIFGSITQRSLLPWSECFNNESINKLISSGKISYFNSQKSESVLSSNWVEYCLSILQS